jgi:hypothetical protein
LYPQYGNTPGGPYGSPPMPQPIEPYPPTKQTNIIGLIALVVSVIGLIFSCIKGALIVGWVLLPIAFILGLVALFQSGKSKGTGIAAVVISVVGSIIGAAVFATVVTDSVHDAFSGPKLSVSPPAAESSAPTPDQSTAGDTAGSRENPYPIGQTVGNQDWKITLGAPHEAWSEIRATNQFNDPPKKGMEFWIVPVTAVYTGDATGNLMFGVTVKFVGSDNRTYGDPCGVIPNPLSDIGDLYKDGVGKGNTCVAVPAGADGLWTVSTGVIGTPTFFVAK